MHCRFCGWRRVCIQWPGTGDDERRTLKQFNSLVSAPLRGIKYAKICGNVPTVICVCFISFLFICFIYYVCIFTRVFLCVFFRSERSVRTKHATQLLRWKGQRKRSLADEDGWQTDRRMDEQERLTSGASLGSILRRLTPFSQVQCACEY